MKKSGWYILLVRQGFEVSIKNRLLAKKEELNIDDVLVSDDLSSYIFINCVDINQNTYHSFLCFEGVIKFLGMKRVEGKNVPQQFSTKDINKLSEQPKPEQKTTFQLGDQVKIKQGDLADIEGELVEIGKRIVKIKPVIFQKIVRARIQDIEFA